MQKVNKDRIDDMEHAKYFMILGKLEQIVSVLSVIAILLLVIGVLIILNMFL